MYNNQIDWADFPLWEIVEIKPPTIKPPIKPPKISPLQAVYNKLLQWMQYVLKY